MTIHGIPESQKDIDMHTVLCRLNMILNRLAETLANNPPRQAGLPTALVEAHFLGAEGWHPKAHAIVLDLLR